MTGGNAIRGTRVGAGPVVNESERGQSAPRQRVDYWCANGHHIRPWFALDAEIPAEWDCPRCGFPAGRDPENPPAPPRNEPYKTHLAYVQERRTDEEGMALVEEALRKLRDGAVTELRWCRGGLPGWSSSMSSSAASMVRSTEGFDVGVGDVAGYPPQQLLFSLFDGGERGVPGRCEADQGRAAVRRVGEELHQFLLPGLVDRSLHELPAQAERAGDLRHRCGSSGSVEVLQQGAHCHGNPLLGGVLLDRADCAPVERADDGVHLGQAGAQLFRRQRFASHVVIMTP